MKIKCNATKYRHIFFVGIGGISLSGMAKWCLHNNIKVSGSDLVLNHLTTKLQNMGAKIFKNHSKKNIQNDVDLVVYTSAIKDNNPEILFAKKQNIAIMERAVFLNEIIINYKNIVAVAGMHGKTTTCGMISSVFIHAKLNPTVHIGGECDITDGNFKIGNKQFFITEACEYKDNFLKFRNTLSVILNIEMDHPDYYKNIDIVYSSFSKFAKKSNQVCVVNEKYRNNLNLNEKPLTFNLNGNADFYAKKIVQDEKGSLSFDCFKNGEFYDNYVLSVFGKHNVLNALATICVADYYKIEKSAIKKGLVNFTGVKRRFELVAKKADCQIIHDYAHHPTEITATINTAKNIFNNKIICVFQPHTFTRTKRLLNEFLTCFNDCDELFLFKTYSAREKSYEGITAKQLGKIMSKTGKKVQYFANIDAILKLLKKYESQNCTILILGAGNIETLAKKILI